MRRFLHALPLVAALALSGAGGGAAAEAIGTVKHLRQLTTMSADGTTTRLWVGAAVLRDAEIVTDGTGRLVIRFADGSELRLGSGARLVLDEAVYGGDGGLVRGAFQLLTGAAHYLRGAATKASAPRDIRIKTPVAEVRTTDGDVWVGEIDGAVGVLALDGRVEVENRGGKAVLDGAGRGTMVRTALAAPDAPITWGEPKKERAAAMTRP